MIDRRKLDYNGLRRIWIDTICATLRPEIKARPVPPMGEGGWWFAFTWHEPDRRRDKDNVRAGGTKLILDALVTAKVLPADDNRYVAGFKGDLFRYGNGGVQVELSTLGASWAVYIPHRLPDENEIGEAREVGAVRGERRRTGGWPATRAVHR